MAARFGSSEEDKNSRKYQLFSRRSIFILKRNVQYLCHFFCKLDQTKERDIPPEMYLFEIKIEHQRNLTMALFSD